MKKVFVSYNFTHRNDFIELHAKLKSFLADNYSLEAYAFVFDFLEKVDDRTIMSNALAKISESDLFIAELSYCSEGIAGIGIEAGYAKARGLQIICIHKQGTELTQAINGIADISIIYKDIDDLINKFKSLDIIKIV